MIIGIDTGGTFTDVVIVNGGRIARFKIPSTPDDPVRVYRDVLHKIAQMHPGLAPERIVYGSTIATNALLEGKLGKCAFVTNSGFEDVFRIGRQNRAVEDLYARVPKPRPMPIPRDHVFGLNVRQTKGGGLSKPLSNNDVAELIVALDELDVEYVGIGLLNSYCDPTVERVIGKTLSQAGFRICLSSDIDQNPYEYERFVTTAVNTGLMPVMNRFLNKLPAYENREPLLMQSNGGVASIAGLDDSPVRLLLSGPAGGVMGLGLLSRWTGETKLIGFDMGGTSTDVAVFDGTVPLRQQLEIAGMPIRCPSLDIHTVGAGGGSIVRIGPGGVLMVGPQSAGASPGPACYGNGGPLTLTDCNLLSGRLPEGVMLAGTMPIDTTASKIEIEKIADKGVEWETIIDGALNLAAVTMAGAVRKASRASGIDPSEFTLIAFGGAGGLHATDLAREIGISKIIIPSNAGVFSALGMALTRPRKDIVRHLGVLWERDKSPDGLKERVEKFIPPLGDAEELMLHVRCRYPGQRFTIELPLSDDLPVNYDAEHLRRYGLSRPEQPIEVVSVVISVLGPSPERPGIKHIPDSPDYPVPIGAVAWCELRVDEVVIGPVAVIGREASAWIPEGLSATLDLMGNLLIEGVS